MIIPQHIAIICDGNRRWAKKQGLPGFEGHRQAVQKVLEPLVDRAIERGVKYLTFWVFSTENWQRDKKEVEGLMMLFRSFFDRQISELNKKGVRVNMIGNLTDFAPDIQAKIKEGMAKTKNNQKITVTLAMSYGGRDEILRSVKKLVTQIQSSQFKIKDLNQESFKQFLDTSDLPDPELIVRTSGEQRLSGFMPWQSVYSEFWFPQFDFPEFSPAKLDEAIEEFNRRQRRFGK